MQCSAVQNQNALCSGGSKEEEDEESLVVVEASASVTSMSHSAITPLWLIVLLYLETVLSS